MQVLGSCQKRFPLTQKEADLASHPVVGLVVQVGDVKKLPRAFGFEGLDPFSFPFFFFIVSKQFPCFTALEEDRDDKRLVEFELVCKADGVAPPDPAEFGHCCHC